MESAGRSLTLAAVSVGVVAIAIAIVAFEPSAQAPPLRALSGRAPEHANDAAPTARTPSPRVRSAVVAIPARVAALGQVPGTSGAYRVENLERDYQQLAAAAAQGDLDAARALYKAAMVCENAPRSRKDLDEIESRLDDPRYIYTNLPEGGRQYYAYQASLLDFCGSLSERQRSSAPEWLAQLAEAGDRKARLSFVLGGEPPADWTRIDDRERREAFTAKAAGYLDEEIDAGDADGLLSMGLGYMPSIRAGHSAPFGEDPEKAYMYFYAYELASAGLPERVDQAGMLAKLEGKLDSQQIANARVLGEALAKRCCAAHGGDAPAG